MVHLVRPATGGVTGSQALLGEATGAPVVEVGMEDQVGLARMGAGGRMLLKGVMSSLTSMEIQMNSTSLGLHPLWRTWEDNKPKKCSLSPAVEEMAGMEGGEETVAWEGLEDEGEMVPAATMATAPALVQVVTEVPEAMEEMGAMEASEGQGVGGEMVDMLALEESVSSKVLTLVCWCWSRQTAGLASRGTGLLEAMAGRVGSVALEGVGGLVALVDMVAATVTAMAPPTTTPVGTAGLPATADGTETVVRGGQMEPMVSMATLPTMEASCG